MCGSAKCSVINMVHVEFVATLLTISLKDLDRKRGAINEKQLCDVLSVLFGYVFLDNDESEHFSLRGTVSERYQTIHKSVKSNVASVSRGGKIKSRMDGIERDGFLDSYGNNLIRQLLKSGKTTDQIATDIILAAAAAIAKQSQQVLTYLLSMLI